jgi:hypothetical protein
MLDKTIVFYRKRNGSKETELQDAIEDTLQGYKIEVCETVNDLLMKLRSMGRDRMIVVLMVSDENDIKDILTIKPLLDDVRIVLILPDAGDDMVAMGHKIHPRFLSFLDGNFQEVAAVLEKIETVGA